MSNVAKPESKITDDEVYQFLKNKYLKNGRLSLEQTHKFARLACLYDTKGEFVEDLIAGDPELVTKTNDHGYTLLHAAAHFNNYGAAKALVERGANCDCRNHDGDTPLSLARHKKDKDQKMIKLLQDHQAP